MSFLLLQETALALWPLLLRSSCLESLGFSMVQQPSRNEVQNVSSGFSSLRPVANVSQVLQRGSESVSLVRQSLIKYVVRDAGEQVRRLASTRVTERGGWWFAIIYLAPPGLPKTGKRTAHVVSPPQVWHILLHSSCN